MSDFGEYNKMMNGFAGEVDHDYETKIAYASDFLEEAKKRNRGLHGGFGDTMCWEKTKEYIQFRPQEITVWGGYNKSGKSLVLGQCALWWALKAPIAIASLEMPAGSTLNRMIRQASGVAEYSDKFADYFIAHVDFNLFIYNHLGEMNIDSVKGMIAATAKQGCKHIIIDSLMMCIRGTEDYDGEKEFLMTCAELAKKYDVHIHIVAHLRKPAHDNWRIPSRFEIKGSGAVSDIPDNVVIVDRNRYKSHLKETNSPKYDEVAPDGFIKIDKQRHGDHNDEVFSFWWHGDSQQWIPKPNGGALPWPNPAARRGGLG